MWRNEDLVRGPRRQRLPARRARRRRHEADDAGAIAEADRRRRARPRAPARVAADARHRRVHARSRRCSWAPRSSRSRAATSTRTSCGETVQRERVTQMAIVGDAFAKPMVRALEEAEADGEPYDLSSLQLIISSGVMWSAEVKHALMARGNFICFDSLGSSEGVGFAGSISAPGLGSRRPRSSRSARARRCSPTTAARSCPARTRSACSRSAATSRSATTRTSASRTATFRDDQRRALVGARRLRPRRGRRHDHAARPRLGRDQLGRREDLPRRGRGGGEGCIPTVADCLVVGVPDERFGEAVTAVVALRPGETRHARASSTAALEPLAALQAPAPLRVRRRDRARPERQGRLQVGQGRSRRRPST